MSNERIDQSIHVRLVVIAALSLGFMARAATYQSPLFDFHSWRQADTATISRNFSRELLNPLYPQIDARGTMPNGFVETGFEIHAFAVALLAKGVGFSPQLGRLLNTALFPLAALLLFRFTRSRYGEGAAVIALCIYALGLPLTLYMDRAFMNEAILALLTFVCLRAAQQYCARRHVFDLLALVSALTLIAIVKPTYLIVWAPVAGLFYERFGRGMFLRWELWGAAAVSLASGGLWFAHARELAQSTGLSFGITDKLMVPEILLSAEYPVKIARRLAADILGPVGFVCTPIGALIAVRRGYVAEALGLLAFAVYLVVVVGGNFHHNYYQLPIVPVAVVLCSLGIIGTAQYVAAKRHWDQRGVILACAAMVWLAVMSSFARSVSAHNWYELDAEGLQLCEGLRRHLSPEDRIIFVGERSPAVLFCVDRKGWLLNPHEETMTHLHDFVRHGASLIVVRRAHALERELAGVAMPLLQQPDYVVFRLKP